MEWILVKVMMHKSNPNVCIGIKQLQWRGGSFAGTGDTSEGPASETRAPPTHTATAEPSGKRGNSWTWPEPEHRVHRSGPRPLQIKFGSLQYLVSHLRNGEQIFHLLQTVWLFFRLLWDLQFWLKIKRFLHNQTPWQPSPSQSVLWYEWWRWVDRTSETDWWEGEV